jgi:hypothetical protein
MNMWLAPQISEYSPWNKRDWWLQLNMPISSYVITWTIKILVLKSVSVNANYFILLWKQNYLMRLSVHWHSAVSDCSRSISVFTVDSFLGLLDESGGSKQFHEMKYYSTLQQHLLCIVFFSGQVNMVESLLKHICLYNTTFTQSIKPLFFILLMYVIQMYYCCIFNIK